MDKLRIIQINSLIKELSEFLSITKKYIISMEEINKSSPEKIYTDKYFYQPCINSVVIQMVLGALEKRNDSIENISSKLSNTANPKVICNILGIKYKDPVFSWVKEGVETVRDFIKFQKKEFEENFTTNIFLKVL